MGRHPQRIIIYSSTSMRQLSEQIAELDGALAIIEGVGARARRLMERLSDEQPESVQFFHTGENEWRAFVNRNHDEAVAWYGPEPPNLRSNATPA